MLTRKALHSKIKGVLDELPKYGFFPEKAILFGSYAKGNVNENSDVDLAVWAEGFSGNPLEDTPKIARLLSLYHPIELHTFPLGATSNDFYFIEEISRTGIVIESALSIT